MVPSTFLWHRVLKERKRRSDFWRWLVSLLVALAVAIAIAAALGRPEIEALSGKARRIAVVIDDSPTMGASTASGETRFDRALEIARELLGEGSASSEYLVTDTAGRLLGTEFGARRTALERLEGLRVSLHESAAFPPADPVLFSDPETEIFFITDGVMVREAPSGVRVISVFEPVDNVGVTAFDLRAVPAEPNRFEAFLELTNHSAEPKRGRASRRRRRRAGDGARRPARRGTGPGRDPHSRSVLSGCGAGPHRCPRGRLRDRQRRLCLPRLAAEGAGGAGERGKRNARDSPRSRPPGLARARGSFRSHAGASAGPLHLRSRRSGHAACGPGASHPSRCGFVASDSLGYGARESVACQERNASIL